MNAVWKLALDGAREYLPLKEDVDVDVAIVGGGITGLATALILSEAGERVAVLEARRVASGTSGGSTGNLYSTLSQSLSQLEKKWDRDTVRQVVALRRQGLEGIVRNVERLAIDCQLERRPLFFCQSGEPGPSGGRMDLEAELEISRAAGLSAELVEQPEGLGLRPARALRVADQAQFNPLLYCEGLARAVTEAGGAIYEQSPVTRVEAGEGRVETPTGTVRAGYIVFATHTPKGINMLQGEMEVIREHGIAAPLRDKAAGYPRAIVWMLDDSYSLRSLLHEGRPYVIAVGQKHKTGHDGQDFFAEMEDYLRSHFDIDEPSHRWSAQQYRSADLLPYVGRSGHDNVYVATGFAADGLVWGEVGAQMISQQILGRKGHGGDLLTPRRFTPAKSAKGWLEANAKVARHLGTDYFGIQKLQSPEQVPPGEGKVAKIGGETYAIYRSPEGDYSALSPVCTHMKCMVHWNPAEKSWDCPCHGSRFGVDGEVLEGPAYRRLEARSLPK